MCRPGLFFFYIIGSTSKAVAKFSFKETLLSYKAIHEDLVLSLHTSIMYYQVLLSGKNVRFEIRMLPKMKRHQGTMTKIPEISLRQ